MHKVLEANAIIIKTSDKNKMKRIENEAEFQKE
jgi:hypothetical protein